MESGEKRDSERSTKLAVGWVREERAKRNR